MTRDRRWALGLGGLVLSFCTCAAVVGADDWPGWRGPDRDGSLAEGWTCSSWPAELNRRWRVPVGGGYSSPVVADERVYQHSREAEQEVVRALDIATGEELWRHSYPASTKLGAGAGKHGLGPKATPALADGRLFTLGISGVLSAWNAADGALLWSLDAADRFEKGAPSYGTASSPLVDQGRVIVYLGGKKGGALLALDAESGNELWSWSDDSPAYASPVAVELDGVRQIVTQSAGAIVAVEAASGQLLWKIPFTSSLTSQNAVTPLSLGDGTLVLSGKKRGLWAVRASRQGESWTTETVWRDDELSTYLSSPVVENGRLFGLSPTKKGRLFAIDARSGRPIWATEGRDTENAALLTAPGVVLVLTAEGELWALDSTVEKLSRLASYRVSEGPTWAHPAVVDDRILIKDQDSLALWVLDCGPQGEPES